MSVKQEARRRGRTRWLLVAPIVGLVTIVTAVWTLQDAHPAGDQSFEVVDAPPLANEDAPTCRRQDEDEVFLTVRDDWTAGERISSEQIYACPQAYDGVEVAFVGEVVGEVLRRRGGGWAQVNDDAYALGVGPLVGQQDRAGVNTGVPVWLPDDLIGDVDVIGRAGVRGDVVLVSGQVVRADPHDGGGTTIRADELTVLADGDLVEAPLHVLQAVVAVVLALAATAAWVWAWQVRRRRSGRQGMGRRVHRG